MQPKLLGLVDANNFNKIIFIINKKEYDKFSN